MAVRGSRSISFAPVARHSLGIVSQRAYTYKETLIHIMATTVALRQLT